MGTAGHVRLNTIELISLGPEQKVVNATMVLDRQSLTYSSLLVRPLSRNQMAQKSTFSDGLLLLEEKLRTVRSQLPQRENMAVHRQPSDPEFFAERTHLSFPLPHRVHG